MRLTTEESIGSFGRKTDNMPFKEIYSVHFGQGNLYPHINLYGWPAMQLSEQSDPSEQFSDFSGLNLKLTRPIGARLDEPTFNSIYVIPPKGVRLNTRLRLSVIFDLPNAGAFTLRPQDANPENESTISHAKDALSSQSIDSSIPDRFNTSIVSGGVSVPEPWSVALNFSTAKHLKNPDLMTTVTCQFNRRFNGIRLNTDDLQSDQPSNLIEPLNYQELQGEDVMQFSNVNWVDPITGLEGKPIRNTPPAQFRLDHAFSGWDVHTLGYSTGYGYLYVKPSGQPYRDDYRVYSAPPSYDIGSIPAPGVAGAPRIQAIGVSLACLGQGWVSVRIRSFQLWYNASRDQDENPAHEPMEE